MSLNYFGSGNYNEQKIGLAYAKKLAKRLALGAQVDYLRTSIAGYGLGLFVKNPVPSRMSCTSGVNIT